MPWLTDILREASFQLYIRYSCSGSEDPLNSCQGAVSLLWYSSLMSFCNSCFHWSLKDERQTKLLEREGWDAQSSYCSLMRFCAAAEPHQPAGFTPSASVNAGFKLHITMAWVWLRSDIHNKSFTFLGTTPSCNWVLQIFECLILPFTTNLPHNHVFYDLLGFQISNVKWIWGALTQKSILRTNMRACVVLRYSRYLAQGSF